MNVRIRRADVADVATMADFNLRLAAETESRPLDRAIVTNGVRRGLEAGDEVQYWVAECNQDAAFRIVAQLMLTREWSDWRDGWMVWLQSVYVLPEFRGQNVFTQLFAAAASSIRMNPDNVGIRLYVERENSAAQAAYRKLGFSDPGYGVLEMAIR